MDSMYESLIARFNRILERHSIKIVSKIDEDNKFYVANLDTQDKILTCIWLSANQMFFDDKSSLYRYFHDAYAVKNYLEFNMNYTDEYEMTIKMANAYNDIRMLEKCKSIEELMLEMDLIGI
jgi:hypothetical protein